MKKRVLILDDSPDNCQELKQMLEDEFHDEVAVDTFLDAEYALQAVNEAKFELLIVDYLLPGQMSGICFIKRVRECHPDLKIILVSAVVATGSPMEMEVKNQLDAEKCKIPGPPIMMFARPISRITFTSFIQFILR